MGRQGTREVEYSYAQCLLLTSSALEPSALEPRSARVTERKTADSPRDVDCRKCSNCCSVVIKVSISNKDTALGNVDRFGNTCIMPMGTSADESFWHTW